MGFWNRAGDILQGSYHQANMWDDSRTFKTNWRGDDPYKAPAYQPTPANTTTYKPDPAIEKMKSDWAAQSKALSDQLAALRYQAQQQPRLPFFDSASNYAQAQAKAGGVVNPIYVDRLNQVIQKYTAQRQQKETENTRTKEDITTALQQALEDTSMTRGRTEEDVTRNLGEISEDEAFNQEAEGTTFDRAFRNLVGDVAGRNLSTSGIGQQEISNAVEDRNLEAEVTAKGVERAKSAQELFKTRTFEDLGKADARATGTATRKKEQADIDLRDYIENLGFAQKGEEQELESERLSRLYQETENQAKLGVNDFIAGLIKRGARAQDIALAQQVYG